MLFCYIKCMPSKNTVKIYAAEHYYHVYNRGVSKQVVFHDKDDYKYFLYLLKRHLDVKPASSKYGTLYRHLNGKVEIIAYCLIPNHFHLLIYNKEAMGMEL